MEIGNAHQKTRTNLYWLLSGFATFVYLLIVSGLMTVPGVEPATKLFLLSFAALLLALPIVIGIWRFGDTDTPISAYPVGPIIGVVLMLQFALSLVQVFAQVLILMRRG